MTRTPHRPSTWSPPWSPSEDAILRSALTAGRAQDAVDALTGRTLSAVYQRMAKLGIKKQPPWSKREEEQLRLNWGDSLRSLARRLGRSQEAVYQHAYLLGLPAGCPIGYEYISTAAERCGYSNTQLRRILWAARVPIRKAITTNEGSKETQIVEPEQVDAAVARWLESEPLGAAARRHGLYGQQLERLLRASGVKLPEKPGNKRHWRIPSVVVDAVVQAERKAA